MAQRDNYAIRNAALRCYTPAEEGKAELMPWKPTDQMTRQELVAQLEQLREVVERLAVRTPQGGRGLIATIARIEPLSDGDAMPDVDDEIARKSLPTALGFGFKAGLPDVAPFRNAVAHGLPVSRIEDVPERIRPVDAILNQIFPDRVRAVLV